MSKEAINPKSLYASLEHGFSHAVKSSASTTIHCSGQVAWNKNKEIVGGQDIGKQAQQALANLKATLTEAGADVGDIVRMRTYVVNHNPALIEPVAMALGEFFGKHMPVANTWIGVPSLVLPEFLVEIEATAEIE